MAKTRYHLAIMGGLLLSSTPLYSLKKEKKKEPPPPVVKDANDQPLQSHFTAGIRA